MDQRRARDGAPSGVGFRSPVPTHGRRGGHPAVCGDGRRSAAPEKPLRRNGFL